MSNGFILSCLTLFGSMFLTTFLRGAQNKNVAGGHKRLAVVFGFAMSLCDILTITLVGAAAVQAAQSGNNMFGFIIAVCGGTGSALGWVLSMVVHDRIMRQRYAERDAQKKLRKRSKQEERVRDILRDELDELEAKGVITINRQ